MSVLEDPFNLSIFTNPERANQLYSQKFFNIVSDEASQLNPAYQ